MLTKQLANQIVEQTMIRLNRNINVMDTNGMILASGELERVENIHEGAVHVAKTHKPLLITEAVIITNSQVSLENTTTASLDFRSSSIQL
jgi:carbohydrate diacid regulator